MVLLETTIQFERILPKHGCAEIDTAYTKEYGELHRVYYDVADLNSEDPDLIARLQPFIKRTNMIISGDDTEVAKLREYLTR